MSFGESRSGGDSSGVQTQLEDVLEIQAGSGFGGFISPGSLPADLQTRQDDLGNYTVLGNQHIRFS